MADMATLAAAIGAEATVRRTWSTDTDKRLVLVDLPRVRTGPSEVGRAISEEQLGAFLERVVATYHLAANGGRKLGSLAKWEGDESDVFMEEVEIALRSTFPRRDLGVTTYDIDSYVVRQKTAQEALRAVRAVDAGDDSTAVAALLNAQGLLVRALGGSPGLCDEARRLRSAQLAELAEVDHG